MSGSLEQLGLQLPVRHSRFARPRRRGESELDLQIHVKATLTSAPSKTGVFGSISSFLPMTDVLAGAAARAASQSTIHPLDTIKVRMQATLKDKKLLSGSNSSIPTTTVSTGKYGIGIGQATNTVRSSPRSVAVATGALLGKLGAEVGSLYKGVLGAAGGAGIAIGTYFAFYGAAKKILEAHSDCSVSTLHSLRAA